MPINTNTPIGVGVSEKPLSQKSAAMGACGSHSATPSGDSKPLTIESVQGSGRPSTCAPSTVEIAAPAGGIIPMDLERAKASLDNQRIGADGQEKGRPLSPDEINARMGGFDLLEMAQEFSTETSKEFSLLENGPSDDKFSLLPTKGLRTCMRCFIPGKEGEDAAAKIWHRVDGSGRVRGTVTGLLRCGSMLCPVCGTARRRHAAELLQGAAQRWMDKGERLAFVTFTVRHYKRDSAADVLGWVQAGWKSVGRSRQVKNRVHGFWRALEWNYTPNGHHLHIHAVAFLREGVTKSELEKELFAAWQQGVTKAGGRSLSMENGFSLLEVTAASDLASYCNKVSYSVAGGLASEAARADEKSARGDGRPVMQLLADAANALTKANSPHVRLTPDERRKLLAQGYADARIFHEIAAAMARKSWIHTPKAKELRALFVEAAEELDADKADGSDEAMKAKGWELVRALNPHQLASVRRAFGMSSIIAAVLTSTTAGDAAMAIHALVCEALADDDGEPPPEQMQLAA